MRIVVDTNIFVSAAFKRNSSTGIALYRVATHRTLRKSIVTEARCFEAIARPYVAPLVRPETRDWLVRLMGAAEFVTITERIAVCRDPTDDKFPELAVNGRADLVLTGDNDLLVLNPFRGIPIVAPATFVAGVP